MKRFLDTSNWTIGRRLYSGFALLILMTTAFSATIWWMVGNTDRSIQRITKDSLPCIETVDEMGFVGREKMTEVVQFLVAGTNEEREKREKNIGKADERFTRLSAAYQEMLEEEQDKALFKVLKESWVQYMAASDEARKFVKADNPVEASKTFDSKVVPSFEKFIANLDKLIQWNREGARGDVAKAVTNSQRMKLMAAGSVLAVILVASVIAMVVARSIVKRVSAVVVKVQNGAQEVTSASAEISASSQKLAEGASHQAASLEETGASLEEISSMTKRNAENAEVARSLANEASKSAELGNAHTQVMNETIEGIVSATNEMKDAMAEIQAASGDISRIIKTIDEIAFQTNILSLNAAVEAARAGEAGAGFAVVADEVRNLAQRSAQAAKETEAIIAKAISRSERGSQVNQRVGERAQAVASKATEVSAGLGEIVVKVKKVDEMVSGIAAASKEQSASIGEVTHAVSEMDKVTQANAANAEESAAAATELDGQSKSLNEVVVELEKLVGDTGKRASTKTAAPNSTEGRGTQKLSLTTPARPSVSEKPGRTQVALQTETILSNGSTRGEVKTHVEKTSDESIFRDF